MRETAPPTTPFPPVFPRGSAGRVSTAGGYSTVLSVSGVAGALAFLSFAAGGAWTVYGRYRIDGGSYRYFVANSTTVRYLKAPLPDAAADEGTAQAAVTTKTDLGYGVYDTTEPDSKPFLAFNTSIDIEVKGAGGANNAILNAVVVHN